MQALDRLLALVCRDLGASRAWLEYASGPAEDPAVIGIPVRGGWRLCAAMPEPPPDAQALSAQLQELARSFEHVTIEASTDAPSPAVHAGPDPQLQQTLDALVERIGAHAAWVIDERSPIVWGTSSSGEWLEGLERARDIGAVIGDASAQTIVGWTQGQQLPPPPADLHTLRPALEAVLADHDAERLLFTYAALARASSERDDWSWEREGLHAITRSFAAIYRLVVFFDAPFSPLHAETTITRAMPVIERQMTEHPPIDPTPKGARVHMFIRPE